MSFSDGCRDTAQISLVHLPIWIWGAAFYVLMTVFAYRFRQYLTWLVAGGIGVEISLVWVMVAMKVFCVFCLANLLVVLAIAILAFERERFWQILAVALLLFVSSFHLLPYKNEARAPIPAIAPDSGDILAKIGKEVITNEGLGLSVSSRVFELEKEIHRIKQERLDQLMSEMLLQKEAAEKGLPVEKLVSDVVQSKAIGVDDGEIDRYYQENLDRLKSWKGTQEELRVRIKTYLEQQKRYQVVVSYAKSLEPKYGVTYSLKEPYMFISKVNVEGSHFWGPADAAVTVVEFSDYQCPACRQAHATVQKVREAFKGKIKWVFKDFPLKKHSEAEPAAEAARCAAEQNKFWEYQDLLYSSQEDFTQERFIQYAKNLGLAVDPFRECLQSRKYKGLIEKDLEDARQVGVDRTPTFIVNGKLMTGAVPFERFQEMIEGVPLKPKDNFDASQFRR